MQITVAMDSFKGSMTSLEAGNAVKNGILKAYKMVDITQGQKMPNIKVLPVADGGEGTVEALTYCRKVTRHTVSVTGPLGEPVQAAYIIVEPAEADMADIANRITEAGRIDAAKHITEVSNSDSPKQIAKSDETNVPNQTAKPTMDNASTGTKTAIIEMAQAAGLPLVPEHLRNPLKTTTYGVGELILHAINQGCRKFIVGIGGSATNDCGIGMLQALGYDILGYDNSDYIISSDNNEYHIDSEYDYAGKYGSVCNNNIVLNDKHIDLKNVGFGANGLRIATKISDDNINPVLKGCQFVIACDVDNPLVGETGCSRIYAPQKGATPDMVKDMDDWMNHFADIVEAYVNQNSAKAPVPQFSNDITHIRKQENKQAEMTESPNRYTPGAGAAGGMGYAFLMFLGGRLMSGAEIVMKWTDLENEIIASNYVITGEGKLDSQSTMGKLPVQIAKLAGKHNKKTLAFAGIVEDKKLLNEKHNTYKGDNNYTVNNKNTNSCHIAKDNIISDQLDIFYRTYEIDRQDMPLELAMQTENACANLERTVEQAISCLLCDGLL